MKAQDLFDIVVTHLGTQGSRARRPGNVFACTLLDRKTGKQCAIGCLLDPENTPAYILNSQSSVRDLILLFASDLPSYFKTHEDLLTDLQYAHDYPWSRLYYLEHELRITAKNHGLLYREKFYPVLPDFWT